MMTTTSDPQWGETGTPAVVVDATEEPTATTAQEEAPPQRGRTWLRWTVPLAALLIGASAGVGVTVGLSDPTTSEEYQALESDLQSAEDRIPTMSDRARALQETARVAREGAAQRQTELDGRAAELDQREADLVAREQAVTAVENQIAATSISHGIWTVGVDIEPGTYRTAEALTGYCYWAIYTSGTNGDDIIENDGPEGGYPTVTLSVGQDFENNGCGTFVKQ